MLAVQVTCNQIQLGYLLPAGLLIAYRIITFDIHFQREHSFQHCKYLRYHEGRDIQLQSRTQYHSVVHVAPHSKANPKNVPQWLTFLALKTRTCDTTTEKV